MSIVDTLTWVLIILGGAMCGGGAAYLIATQPEFGYDVDHRTAVSRFVAALLACAGLGTMTWTAIISSAT